MANGPRVKVVEEWKTCSGIPLSIEISREEDKPLIKKFLNEQTRLQEPLLVATTAQVDEVSTIFGGLLDRSAGSGVSLLMFNKENGDLIGIRLASIADVPKDHSGGEFKLKSDYKDFIDKQPGSSRKNQQISAILELAGEYGSTCLPTDCRQYFVMEMISVKPAYMNQGLGTKLYQELFKLVASKNLRFGEVVCTAKASQRVCQKLGLKVKLEIPYDKFLDGGNACFKDTPDGGTGAQLLIADLKELGFM